MSLNFVSLTITSLKTCFDNIHILFILSKVLSNETHKNKQLKHKLCK